MDWSEEWNECSFESVAIEILKLVESALGQSLLSKWFDYIFTTVPAGRIKQYCSISYETSKLNEMEPLKDGMDEKAQKSPNHFLIIFDNWWSSEVENEPRIDIEVTYLKEKADKLAAEKKYEEAIAYYDMVTVQALGESSLIMEALTNCAALRLRICRQEPRQYVHYSDLQFDCTMALEIDPNNIKALFRRGLGLALSKKWNEAIVDFERAVKLDPNSPAKRELEVARR